MRLKDHFIVRRLGRSTMLIDTTKTGEREGIYKLNSTSRYVLDLLMTEDLSSEEIICRVAQRYKVSPDVIKNDILSLLGNFTRVEAIIE